MKHLLLPLSLLASLPAAAACPETSVSALACGDSVIGQLDAGAWTGASPPAICEDAFNDLQSDIGAFACASASGSCFDWACVQGNAYSSCPAGSIEVDGEGPEDVYDFVCPASGTADLVLTGLDCDVDLYVLDSACNPSTGCLMASQNSGSMSESGTLTCIPGEPLSVVIEGGGFIAPAHFELQFGLPGYCNTHTLNPLGNYTLSVSCDDPPLVEDCDTVGDEDGDGDADCADSDCFAEAFCCDDDQDGFDDVACGGGDCDDTVFDAPSADADNDNIVDTCDNCPSVSNAGQQDGDGDGVGNACDICPAVDDNGDGDGDGVICALDCDDGDGANYPGNTELCDGQDNDCDAQVDENIVNTDYWPDTDGDGFGDSAGPILSACDGQPPNTADNSTDCHDGAANTFPGATELPDGQDNDCDGIVDETTQRFDDDGDGFTEIGGDCDDADATVNPGVVETCDGIDEDCDGVPDNGTDCRDDDGDGYCEGPTCITGLPGDCHDGDATISPGVAEVLGNGVDDDCDGGVDADVPDPDGDGVSSGAGDCGPNDATVFPGAPELPDSLDNDCDGTVDEGTAAFDDDGDGATELGGDCNDADAAVSPAATELPNGVDDDCDGTIDEGTDAGDDDGDGFTENGGDCDDTDAAITPGASESANGIDDDCDGEIDEDLTDRDQDGFTTDDCDDEDGFVNPGIEEICEDRIDNNCDGEVDEGCDGPDPTPPSPPDSKCSQAGSGSWTGVVEALITRRRR